MMSGTGFSVVDVEAESPEDSDNDVYANEGLAGPGLYTRGPNGSLIQCSGEYISKVLREDQEREEKMEAEEEERERKQREKEQSMLTHPDIKQSYHACKCGRLHAKCDPQEVMDVWNSMLREARKIHETNMRIVLFAPLLYNRSMLAPKWQQWMRKLGLIIDDKAPLERKKEVFFKLDELDKVLEFIHTQLSTVTVEDYNAMTSLLTDIEKITDFGQALDVSAKHPFFKKFYETLKTRKKMRDSRLGRILTLVTIKHYWLYVHHTVIHKTEVLASLIKLSEKDVKKMNHLKDKGNYLFHNSKYRDARKRYTEALAIGVFNHILYSNRCQTAMYMEDYWDALWDARRAVTIKPDWQKGHYRYAQAMFELKDIDRALRENRRGQKLCQDAGTPITDLLRQHSVIQEEKQKQQRLLNQKHEVPDLVSDESESCASSDDESGHHEKARDLRQDLQREKQNWKKAEQDKAREAQMEKQRREEQRKKKLEEDKKRQFEEWRRREEESKRVERERAAEERKRKERERMAQAAAFSMALEEQRREEQRRKEQERAAKSRAREEPDKKHYSDADKKKKKSKKRNKKEEARTQEEPSERNKEAAKKEEDEQKKQEEEERRQQEKLKSPLNRSQINSILQEASLALIDGKSRHAVASYDRAAELMDVPGVECGGMHEVDYIIFLYAQATAYLASGIPVEINEAVTKFMAIKEEFPGMKIALPFYGLAKALYKLNRFTDALEYLEKSLFIMKHFPGTILTWPGTMTTIPETEKGKLEEALNDLRALCKTPPTPDAVCRFKECSTKREMYLSDLDFKGFIRVQCSERCFLDYHVVCWKARKSELDISIEKDALNTACPTPDCVGKLSNIRIIGSNGLLKTEVKAEKPPKAPKEDAKPKVHAHPQGKHRRDQRKEKKYRKLQHEGTLQQKSEKGQGDTDSSSSQSQTVEKGAALKKDEASKLKEEANRPRAGSDPGVAISHDFMLPDSSAAEGEKEDTEDEFEMKPEATFMLKRDDFPDGEMLLQKRTKVKSKKKKRIQLDEGASAGSNFVMFDFGNTEERRLYGADDSVDFEQQTTRPWQPTLAMSTDRPFALPDHLAQAALDLDLEPAGAIGTKPKLVFPESDEERSKKLGLFLHFIEIFKTHGPLALNDPIIVDAMTLLTLDHQNLILKWGGLREFLAESPDFFVLGNFVSLKEDQQRCIDLAFPDGVMESEIGATGMHERGASQYPEAPTLNPNVPPFVPNRVMGDLSVDPNRIKSYGMNSLDPVDDVSHGRQIPSLDAYNSATDDDEEDSDTSVSSDDNDSDEDSENDDHDAASDANPKRCINTMHSGDEATPVTHLDNFKDGIDDDDYHWQDYYSSKGHTFEDSEEEDDDDGGDDGDDEREEEESLITVTRQETDDEEKEGKAFDQTTDCPQGVQFKELSMAGSEAQDTVSEEQETDMARGLLLSETDLAEGGANEISHASKNQTEAVCESIYKSDPICNIDLGPLSNESQCGKQDTSVDRDMDNESSSQSDGSVHSSLKPGAEIRQSYEEANDPTNSSEADISNMSSAQPKPIPSKEKANDKTGMNDSQSDTELDKFPAEFLKDDDSSSDVSQSQIEMTLSNTLEESASQIVEDKDRSAHVNQLELNSLVECCEIYVPVTSQSQVIILPPSKEIEDKENTNVTVEDSYESEEIGVDNSLTSQESESKVGTVSPIEESDTEMQETSVKETNREMVETHETSVVEPNCDMTETDKTPTCLADPKGSMEEALEIPDLESDPEVMETDVDCESNSDEVKSEKSLPRASSDDNDDEGTSVDGVFRVDPLETSAFENSIASPTDISTNADATQSNTKLEMESQSSTQGSGNQSEKESDRDGEETSNVVEISNPNWQELFEEKFEQWKQQRPPSPVHEMKTVGVNTNTSAWKLEEEVTELRRTLAETMTRCAVAEMKSSDDARRYECQLEMQATRMRASFNEKRSELNNQYLKEKENLERTTREMAEEFRKRQIRYNELEDKEELFEIQRKQFERTQEAYNKLTLSSSQEKESLRSEIATLKDTVKSKEKVNKTLDAQSKKLKTEKLGLEGTLASRQKEVQSANDARLMAEARHAQIETQLQEMERRPRELTEANQALEKRLTEREKEAKQLQERACKAESNYLQVLCSEQIKPLEEACREAESQLNTINSILMNNPTMEEYVREIRSLWQDCLTTNKCIVAEVKSKFKDQKSKIMKGATLDSLNPIEIPVPYKPDGLAKAVMSPTASPRGMPASGSWLVPGGRGGANMQPAPIFHLEGGVSEGVGSAHTLAVAPQGVENPATSQPLTVSEAQRKAQALSQAQSMAHHPVPAQAQAQAQSQSQYQAPVSMHTHPQQQQRRQQSQMQSQGAWHQKAMHTRQSQAPPTMQAMANQQAQSAGSGLANYQQHAQGHAHAQGMQKTAHNGPQRGQPDYHPSQYQVVPPNVQQQSVMQAGAHHHGAMSHQLQQPTQLSRQQQKQLQAARHQQMEQQVTRPRNSFERIMLRLSGFYPNYNKVQLTGFLKEVRTANNGSLSGLSVDEIVRRVDELVRQRRKDTSNMASQRMHVKGNSQGLVSRSSAAPPATFTTQAKRPTGSFHPAPTPATPAWGAVGVTFAQQSSNWHKEVVDGEGEEEDPCVICHEEMSGDDIQELQCGHIFHANCITEWLKQQNTCPFCRTYTILKTDYPNLGK